jgi:thioredoxin 1
MRKLYLITSLLIAPYLHLSAQELDSTPYYSLTYPAFQKIVSSYQQYVLVHFKADWCLVCKREAPLLKTLQEENSTRLKIIEINLDENPLLGQYYEMDALPAHLLFSHGVLKWNKVGLLDPKEILEVMKVLDKKKSN